MAKFDMAKVRSSISRWSPRPLGKLQVNLNLLRATLNNYHCLRLVPSGNFFFCVSYRSHNDFGNFSTMIQT